MEEFLTRKIGLQMKMKIGGMVIYCVTPFLTGYEPWCNTTIRGDTAE
jgi:uncharacterized membrane protein (DUF485 family)